MMGHRIEIVDWGKVNCNQCKEEVFVHNIEVIGFKNSMIAVNCVCSGCEAEHTFKYQMNSLAITLHNEND